SRGQRRNSRGRARAAPAACSARTRSSRAVRFRCQRGRACGEFTLEFKALMQGSLQGRSALVTGGARRIGAAISRRLHAAGANVLVHYRNTETDASRLVAELNALRPKSAAK